MSEIVPSRQNASNVSTSAQTTLSIRKISCITPLTRITRRRTPFLDAQHTIPRPVRPIRSTITVIEKIEKDVSRLCWSHLRQLRISSNNMSLLWRDYCEYFTFLLSIDFFVGGIRYSNDRWPFLSRRSTKTIQNIGNFAIIT
jgi:hypothetical protein